MKYVDLHCDTVTECFDGGYALANCGLQTDLEKLNKGKCAAQCFAIYTQGDGAAVRFKQCLAFYKQSGVKEVLNYADLEECLKSGAGGILTVENLGFIEDVSQLEFLFAAGVKMASLVWNIENSLACPNGARGGLKPFGREVLDELDRLKIIVDISHLSDGGAAEILAGRKIPVVASHSNAKSVCNVPRNLSDDLIKKIADCGGVVGVNFCKKFLGEGETFESVFAHVSHIIDVGGEDTVAIGSDFDGIPAPENLEDCTKMPALISYLEGRGLKQSAIEKLCFDNFVRVFKDICG